MDFENFSPKIGVLGLGYVGLPLAVELSKFFPVWMLLISPGDAGVAGGFKGDPLDTENHATAAT